MKKTLFAAALATTLLAGGAAFAGQEAPGPMRDPLNQADTDKDGVVTKAELLADVDARFARIDTNHDGKISPEEREAGFAAMRAKMGEGRGFGMGGRRMGMRADADGDGTVTLEEQRAQALKRFARIDANGDGKVDQAERDQMRDRMMAMRGPGGPGHHRGPPPGDGPPPPPPADAPDGPDGQ